MNPKIRNKIPENFCIAFSEMYLFKNLPKIIAMLLNSLGMYATSEKSARYTIMKPETELEETLYNKWITYWRLTLT